ncbi:hypothetical protein TRFO_21653 [Tritrichomonas foetus]|uniref:Uncharacterized protein n=1 Tax=Tritrichomonas foetus TaxID=1144522 RepID=A0A1J4KIB1_9EUKA|nr:hypothetical protein TRFO_21653 [Tritrichomonas foetus]|eukprot:OHT09422.1 hypothetical protein TRFO_21653 [Tritrichomonas foetus]
MESEKEVIELQTQLEKIEKQSSLKDAEIQALQDRNKKLEESILQLTKSEFNEYSDYFTTLIQDQYNEYKKYFEENLSFSQKYIKILAKKNHYKKMYNAIKLKSVPFSPKSPSGYEAENQKLTIENQNLKHELEFAQEQISLATEESQKYQNELTQLHAKYEEINKNGVQNFQLMKAKLDEQRESMKSSDVGQTQLQNEELQKEIDTLKTQHEAELEELKKQIETEQQQNSNLEKENKILQESIISLQEACSQMTTSQTDFISSLGEVVGCQEISEISTKVKELSLLPAKILNLQQKIATLKGGEEVNLHDDVIDALQQIQKQISPNELKLPRDSELKQLFAALCNMFNAALDPKASKSFLKPHILSVVHQARNFTPSSEKEANDSNPSSLASHSFIQNEDAPETKQSE